jgi:2-dehydro-3-deoxygluconokinase
MKIICFGEIMLRLSTPNQERLLQTRQFEVQYGGSEANVAVSLAQLGANVAFVTRIPETALGQAALSEVLQYNVDTNLSVFGGERLGLYYLETGKGNRPSKVIYDRDYSGMATLKSGMIDWDKVFENATWFHWSGITPAISQSAADVTLEAIEAAQSKGLMISCDLNYRSNLWQYGKSPFDIMPQLLKGCDVMLGDGDTIETYFKIKGTDYQDIVEKTFAAFPKLKYIAMTARRAFHASHNAYKGFLHDGKTMYETREYDIPDITDRIGAGDAFMASLIFQLSKKAPPSRKNRDFVPQQYIIDFATAAATLKHTVQGDFNLVSEAEILALMDGNTGGKVSR